MDSKLNLMQSIIFVSHYNHVIIEIGANAKLKLKLKQIHDVILHAPWSR